MTQRLLGAATVGLLVLGMSGAGARAATVYHASANGDVSSTGYYNSATTTSKTNSLPDGAVEQEGPTDPNDSGGSGKYEAYGVIDFTGAALSGVGSITNLTFTGFDDGSKYEDSGMIDFYLVSNPAAIGSGLTLAPTVMTNPVGVPTGSALGTLYSLGSYKFTQEPSGTYDVPQIASLSVSPAALSAFDAELAAGNIGILYTADVSTPGATMYLDSYNSQYVPAGSTMNLSFTEAPRTPAVPEPSALALLGLGLLPIGRRARKTPRG